MRRKSITLILMVSMILSLVGCSVGTEKNPVGSSEEIELIEPVNAEVSYEEAAIRDLYDATVYAATVLPVIREYSPEYGFTFGALGASEGEQVKAGQQLVSANTEAIDEQIKAKKEYIASMEEDYNKYVEKQQKSLAEYRRKEDYAKWVMSEYEKVNEPETIPAEDGSDEMVDNPDYPAWKAGYDACTGDYRIAKHAGDIIELELEQKKELYDLDLAHQKYLLKILQRSRQNAMITAAADGEVVLVDDFDEYLPADVPVMAVADMSQKIMKCEYVNANRIRNAQEVYALVDGVKYQVDYQAISSDEYARQSANGGKVYSTFYFRDGADAVEIGDYAVIVVIAKRYEKVLSVPKGSIRKDELGSYVYVYSDGKSIRSNVQTGYSDGTYVEILNGLSEGDKVLYSAAKKPNGNGTITLKKGEFHTEFENTRAELTYTTEYDIKNPVENGTTYFGEYQVEMFQHVNKGDVIATVRVEADQIALQRNETRLKRLTERFEEYKKEHEKETEEEYYIESVKNYEEQIAEVSEAIAKQKKDFNTKAIVAPRTGVILYLYRYETESIVRRDATVAVIADEGTCYIQVEDSSQMLQYGNYVTVKYKDAANQEKEVVCKVATMSRIGVSQGLQTDTKKILLPEDSVEDILQGALAGDWWDRYRYSVKGTVRTMDNVVVVPRSAVYDIGGKTYVFVKDENGKTKMQYFVSGGYNDGYYWVVEGLTEGMVVCSE